MSNENPKHMTQFESSVKIVPYGQECVYTKLSDLNHIENVKEKIPQDKIENLTFDADTLSLNVASVGKLILKIIEREPPKCIKFETVQSPIPFNLWIQLLPVSEEKCKIKLTLHAEINIFMKGIIQKPLKEGLEKMVETLATIQYE
ncbi:hypothetical protein EZS27_008062 [termite gut metagenome]|uniref:Polyketide cyclase / dehydrase and lipid transport n=1 Tax=termite gut metagenome TaxID=433724 RepID=A0A5J4SGB2_9ZZZZ